jgi:xanthine dehydrogenase accessory factor
MNLGDLIIVIKSGGEVGSAVAHRLYYSNFHKICITESPHPNSVSRPVCFSEAVFQKNKDIEGIKARLVTTAAEIRNSWDQGDIPLIVDTDALILNDLHPDILIDAIMAKKNLHTHITDAKLVIGLGPGFNAGKDVHVVIETNNSEQLGKVITSGTAENNTGLPVIIGGYGLERVAHAEGEGIFSSNKEIGDIVKTGDVVASISKIEFHAQINGIVRAILRNGTRVQKDVKLFEIDPEADIVICNSIRSRMRSIAGGVLEAILMKYNKS